MKRFGLLALSLGAACATPKLHDKDYARELPPGAKGLRLLDPSKWPDFSAGYASRDGMLAALDASAEYLSRPSSLGYFPYFPEIDHDRAEATIRAFRRDLADATSSSDLVRRLRERYDAYESVGWNGKGEMLFTGYHEPIYEGSLERTARCRFPIYRRPPELETDETGEKGFWRHPDGTRTPAPARAELARTLPGRRLELAYLADPFEAYVVQVQGSARLRLPDGRELRVGYAGDNGLDYQPIWQPLVESGKLKKSEVSLRRLRDYFQAHPQEFEGAVNHNPRFVFFQERTGPAVGCLNVPVTARHSIATDRNRKDDVFPRAGVAFVQTTLPVSATGPDRPYAGFVCDQDRGGAIRSAGRADLFLGTGDTAEALAGRTHAEGRLTYLFLKTDKVPAVVAELRAEKAAKAAAKPAASKKPALTPKAAPKKK